MMTPGPRAVAPRAGVLLPAGWRPAAGHGPLLPDRTGPPARPVGGWSPAGSARGRDDRPGPRAGTRLHGRGRHPFTGVLEHEGGAADHPRRRASTWAPRAPPIEVYGTAGSLSVPDPNNFDGEVVLPPGGAAEWTGAPAVSRLLRRGPRDRVLDLVTNLRGRRPHRASADVALHVLDVMETLLRIDLCAPASPASHSRVQPPAPCPGDSGRRWPPVLDG